MVISMLCLIKQQDVMIHGGVVECMHDLGLIDVEWSASTPSLCHLPLP
jgi:hypothetical protein